MTRTAVQLGVIAALGLACLTPWVTPPLALLAGIAIALSLGNPRPRQIARGSKLLLQTCVVLLGFSVDLWLLLRVGGQGIAVTAIGIGATMLLGAWLGRSLRIERVTSTLISSGTAICGGSAIAAVGTTLRANASQLSVAIGVVFLLNAAALYSFPWIGAALHLTPGQFGLWSGMAVHDISSVVGTATQYDRLRGDATGTTLQIATAVKLSRTLWIVPLALVFAGLESRRLSPERSSDVPAAKVAWPWFIGLFVIASILSTALPPLAAWRPQIGAVSRAGFTLTLFLIGLGIDRRAIASVGWRAMVQGTLLWIAIASGTLVYVYFAVSN